MNKSTKPTPDSIALRILIRDKSTTKSGFTRQDAAHLLINKSLISARCGIMEKDSVLFRGEARGQALHFFATEEAAKKWEASIPPYVKKRKKIGAPRSEHKQTAASRFLLKVILEKAATPEGFTTSNRPDCVRRTSVWARCSGMMANGELFVATVERGVSYYFTTKSGAVACREAYLERLAARTQASVKERKRIEAKAVIRAIPRKPYTPPVKTVARIVYPDDYTYIKVPPYPQRFTAFERPAFLHGGMGAMR